MPRIVTGDVDEAERFFDDALERGHEGVMVKALDAPYEAGRRGASWLKVKRAHTLDLVVLAAEWGHGRRRGWLSNLHLGARDPATGGFVMLGKTFKGMTDEMLAWQTERLLADRDASRGHHRVRAARARRRGRLRRPAAEPEVSGRARPALRAGEGLPARQARRGRRHDRHRSARSTRALRTEVWISPTGAGRTRPASARSRRARALAPPARDPRADRRRARPRCRSPRSR